MSFEAGFAARRDWREHKNSIRRGKKKRSKAAGKAMQVVLRKEERPWLRENLAP